MVYFMTESCGGAQQKFLAIIFHPPTHKCFVGIGAEFILAIQKRKGLQRNEIVDTLQDSRAYNSGDFVS